MSNRKIIKDGGRQRAFPAAFCGGETSLRTLRTGTKHAGNLSAEPVGQLVLRRLGRADPPSQDLRDVEHGDEVTSDREKPFAFGSGIHHRAEVQIRDVADIDDAEHQLRAERNRAIKLDAARFAPTSDRACA
jgi:hypothetical protein